MKTYIFVDCEGHGASPANHSESLFEFGAVSYPSRQSFHGKGATLETFVAFRDWLNRFEGHKVFVSDNPAYDWQFINFYFHKFMGDNPFGHSARRISDFYAGLKGNWEETQGWKSLRVTDHDHNPVHDALGNVEAFDRIIKGERP